MSTSGQQVAPTEVQRRRPSAVLTGDLVGSTRLRELDPGAVPRVLREASVDLRLTLHDQMPLEVDNFGGDSWQVYLPSPERALWAALYFRACLLASTPSVDTRIAIGIGAVDYVPSHRVSEGQGEAFEISGRLLRSMTKTPLMRFGCSDEARQVTWDAVVQLVDCIIAARWTQPRARAVVGAFHGLKQHDIARLWLERTIKQPSVSGHLDKAGWSAIRTAVGAFDLAWRDGI
jgi:hypothetical protein